MVWKETYSKHAKTEKSGSSFGHDSFYYYDESTMHKVKINSTVKKTMNKQWHMSDTWNDLHYIQDPTIANGCCDDLTKRRSSG